MCQLEGAYAVFGTRHSSNMADLEKARLIKEKGNNLFKEKKYREAAECYSNSLILCTNDEPEKAIFLKNRAACWLKLKSYDKALTDCIAALKISPSDAKTLYRHAQALEGKGNLSEALRQLKKLLAVDSKNKEAVEMARRLTATLKLQSEKMQSTDGVVEGMFAALNSKDTSLNGRIQAAKNLAILSREPAGASRIFQSEGVSKLMPLLNNESPELVNHTLHCYVGLCSGHKARAYSVLQSLSLEHISKLIASSNTNVAISTVVLLKEVIIALTSEDKRKQKNEDTSVVFPANSLVLPILQMIFISLASHDVTQDARDTILELFVRTAPQPGLATLYLEQGVVLHILQLAALTGESDKELEEDGVTLLPISNECRMNASLVLAALYSELGKEGKEEFKSQCTSFIIPQLQQESREAQRMSLTALATILQGVVEVGSSLVGTDIVLKRTVELAETECVPNMIVATEVLALAVTDKANSNLIMEKGLPALKTMYHCSDERVCVRALVGMCKLGTSGGGNVNAQPFAKGATLKLANTCRKVLVNHSKGSNLKKWAGEGIAFLSLDAEVKEALIKDEAALKVLFKMAESPDKSLLYGIASLFVNLTNSYDKPEKNPELEELGKFAGENVPKEHEWDGEEYVKARVAALLKFGVVRALLSLSVCESKQVHEQIARVLLALSTEVSHRGAIIQQGGVKCLIPLASNSTKKGQLLAAQALAKIAITNDPKLAFPGERKMEVVRPLTKLLQADHGLQQFEGLMALTNLASLGDDVRKRILNEGAVTHMEGLMFEEHDLIRRAATEALCNMIPLEEVHKRFYNDDIERVKLWTLFSGEDDPLLARAASGGLAQLSYDPKICKQIMAVEKSREIFKELVSSDNKELQHRSMYILANMVEADKDIAAQIIEEEFLEIFLAYAQGNATGISPEARIQAERALKAAEEHGLIKENPEAKK